VPSAPRQQRRRDQVEAVLRLGAPLLDLVLAAGERVSRIAGRDDDDRYAIRPAGERLQIDVRGLRSVPPSRQPEA
jgi:hypothetical protein